jgi:hypothetical protein
MANQGSHMPATGQTPMERFQAESFGDGPWNAVAEVAVSTSTKNAGKAASQVMVYVSSTRATQGSAEAVAEIAAKET